MASVNLQEVHDFLISLAREAGATIIAAKPSNATAGTKKNSADIVTETDQAVEHMVSSRLRAAYPAFAFMGEETYKPGQDAALTDDPTFIVDPIDGTTNFLHGFPYFCISLGLALHKKPVVGVVFNPLTGALYSAIKGQGAYLTDASHDRVRLPLRSPPEPMSGLDGCLVAAEWGSDRSGNDYAVKTATFAKLCATREDGGAMVHSIRSLGSAALNLCGVAAGWLDLYWEAGCWAWDVCAGWIILEEAGGLMVGCHEGDWEPEVEQRRYMGVRAGEGQREVVQEFWRNVQGRVEVGYDRVSK